MARTYNNYFVPYEVCDILGISLTTVYALLRKGKLPATKIGRQWRVPRSALEQFIDRYDRW